MRIENIADVFDSNGLVVYNQVNVLKIAQELFALSNDVDPASVHVHLVETTLTAN
jgi:hypothetical protein